MLPTVKPLPIWRRKLIFIVLTLTFLLSLPVFVFYATGYRYDIFGDSPSITATGGLYISSTAKDTVIYINETEVDNARVFRKAAYIQGLEPKTHRVHVQAEGLHTWVKNLQVYPQIVTEGEAFNLPVIPQVRMITEFTDQEKRPVTVVQSATSTIFTKASTTLPVATTTRIASSTHELNPEFVLMTGLFTDKASTTLKRIEMEKQIEKDKIKFGFSTNTPERVGADINDLATTTKIRDNLMLYEEGDDVFVQALGTKKQIPHYFCTNQISATSSDNVSQKKAVITEQEVLRNIFYASKNIPLDNAGCRKKIRVDRKWQTVYDFTFFPDNSNLILMHLDDGIYVVEIDDRAWQNVQLLYPGNDLVMLVHNEKIFIQDGDFIVEAYTEIISP